MLLCFKGVIHTKSRHRRVESQQGSCRGTSHAINPTGPTVGHKLCHLLRCSPLVSGCLETWQRDGTSRLQDFETEQRGNFCCLTWKLLSLKINVKCCIFWSGANCVKGWKYILEQKTKKQKKFKIHLFIFLTVYRPWMKFEEVLYDCSYISRSGCSLVPVILNKSGNIKYDLFAFPILSIYNFMSGSPGYDMTKNNIVSIYSSRRHFCMSWSILLHNSTPPIHFLSDLFQLRKPLTPRNSAEESPSVLQKFP